MAPGWPWTMMLLRIAVNSWSFHSTSLGVLIRGMVPPQSTNKSCVWGGRVGAVETESVCVALAILELISKPGLPPKCWGWRHSPPHQQDILFLTNVGVLTTTWALKSHLIECNVIYSKVKEPRLYPKGPERIGPPLGSISSVSFMASLYVYLHIHALKNVQWHRVLKNPPP